MRYRVAENGRFLSTRDRGAALRAHIESLLRQASPAEALILDFADVELMSSSVADEIVARVMIDRATSDLGNGPVLVENANLDLVGPIVRSLQRRGLVGAAIEGERIDLLAAPSFLQTTFDAALARREFWAADLAADLGIGLQDCNDQLRKLMAAGLINRAGQVAPAGDCDFRYRVMVPVPELA